MTRIDVYPAFDPLYYSYFVAGLKAVHGASSVRFTTRGFPRFTHRGLAFRIETPGGERRIFIHASDDPDLPEEGLQWCHTMGKVNVDSASVPEELRSRVVCLGPIFPFRVWGGPVSLARGALNLLRANSRLRSYESDIPSSYPRLGTMPLCAVLHLKQYVKIGFQRLPLESFRPGATDPHYVFFSSAIWPEDHPVASYAEANRVANAARVEFIRALKEEPGLRLEGGIFMRSGYMVRGYEGLTHSKTDGHRQYISKTKASCVVFNAPSVKWCHSWKLGEYLALGKAIISLPIVRDLPAPLEHGVHVHYVDGSAASMREAITLISRDAAYRTSLERNAREYHDRYLAPPAMMARLLREDQRLLASRSIRGNRGARATPPEPTLNPA